MAKKTIGKSDIHEMIEKADVQIITTGEEFWEIHTKRGSLFIVFDSRKGVLQFQISFMSVPDEKKELFYRQLLLMNYDKVSHGAFAIDTSHNVHIIDRIPTEMLDPNEVKATIDSVFTILDEYGDQLVGW